MQRQSERGKRKEWQRQKCSKWKGILTNVYGEEVQLGSAVPIDDSSLLQVGLGAQPGGKAMMTGLIALSLVHQARVNEGRAALPYAQRY